MMKISTTLAAVIGFAALAACGGEAEDTTLNAEDNALMTDMNAGMDMNMTDMNADMNMMTTDNLTVDANNVTVVDNTTGTTTDTNTAGNTL